MKSIGDVLGAGAPTSTPGPHRNKHALRAVNLSEAELLTSEKARLAADGGEWCETCRGTRWVSSDRPVGDPEFSKVKACPACRAGYEQRRLEEMSRLLPQERATCWDDFREDVHGPLLRNHMARVISGSGMLLLRGRNGVGKTFIMQIVANAARHGGLSVVYVNAVELLNDLRRSYGEDAEADYETVYQNVMACRVLLLDELDKVGTKSDWALTQIHLLIDDRWRRIEEMATVAAINDVRAVAPAVLSRFSDQRRGAVTHLMQPVDVRQDGLDAAAEERERRLEEYRRSR